MPTEQQRVTTAYCVGELYARRVILGIEEYVLDTIFNISITARLGNKLSTEQVRIILTSCHPDSVAWDTYRKGL